MDRKPKVSGKDEVDGFMTRLEHPLKEEIEAVRRIILGADPRIQESVKWNAPSFYTTEHFATLKLRPVERLHVVFHTGAKVKEQSTALLISDPAGLLQWAAKDRGVVTFTAMDEIRAKESALVAIVQQWIEQI